MLVLCILSLFGKLILQHNYLDLFLQGKVKLRGKFCKVCPLAHMALVSQFLFTDDLYLWKKNQNNKTTTNPNKACYNYLSTFPQKYYLQLSQQYAAMCCLQTFSLASIFLPGWASYLLGQIFHPLHKFFYLFYPVQLARS